MNKMSAISTITNNTTYSGKLSVKLKHKGKVFPFMFFNHGTKYMFDSITKILAGYSGIDIVPRYFDFQHTGNGDNYISCLSAPLKLTGAVYGETAGADASCGKVLFNVLLNSLDKSSIQILTNPRVVLLTEKGEAVAVIESSELQTLWSSVVPGTEALFEWTMTFKNEQSNSNGGNE